MIGERLMKNQDKKPFHESIVDAINKINETEDIISFLCLMPLIKETKIPANHKTIIDAIERIRDKIDTKRPDMINICNIVIKSIKEQQ